MNTTTQIINNAEMFLQIEYNKTIQNADLKQLNYALSKAVLNSITPDWDISKSRHNNGKKAYYFSAEFLMGRAIFNNLYCINILDEVKDILASKGVDINMLEDVTDDALGNGGLGRLAACFLDSAATINVPLYGYGIRYKYGLFKQKFENGFQKEQPDSWLDFNDPWGQRCEEERVLIEYGDSSVYAVPYDTPIIGYKANNINTLRLWQSEAISPFDFELFNNQKYDQAAKQQNDAANITMFLYPNDDTIEGKKLRLKQQYFFSSASLQDIVKNHVKKHGNDFSYFAKENIIQLNDTHPVISIPEFVRVLMEDFNIEFKTAFEIAKKSFAYTNHTIMAEALEKWDVDLVRQVIPKVLTVIELIDKTLLDELKDYNQLDKCKIISQGVVNMANLAIYSTSATNGVAKIHTEILKSTTLNYWYEIYPERFQNKTNGITQRRWLGVCNPRLSSYLDELGIKGCMEDLSNISGLNKYEDDPKVLNKLWEIKEHNKQILCDYIEKRENVKLSKTFIFDVQIKRMHEYKRQLMNAFSILDIYFSIKDGSLKDFNNTVFIFGAKAAPGYVRAKAIIKFINEIAKLINNDKEIEDKIKVLFVTNYNVSYAEKLIPATDISEQISTAGTEASGTSNMKFMLNGAVTLGTFDGANIEIVEKAGLENSYIFGAKIEDIEKLKPNYDPKQIYQSNKRIKRVVDCLIDGTFSDDNTGMFKELYNSILEGASWHSADNYFILHDFESYVHAKIKVNRDYSNKLLFSKKCLKNIANSEIFSSDRTIKEYAHDIWKLI